MPPKPSAQMISHTVLSILLIPPLLSSASRNSLPLLESYPANSAIHTPLGRAIAMGSSSPPASAATDSGWNSRAKTPPVSALTMIAG
jgi:hypothetical protein